MFQLRMASEIVNLINFVLLDFVMLSYIMYMSGLLAGHANHFTLTRQNRLDLVPCDIPLIGGGLCMSKGRFRFLLLALRLSAVVAVFACNFGLEGRSRPRMSTRTANIRFPGPPPSALNVPFNVYVATELRQRCVRQPDPNIDRNDFSFGAVIDNRCYPQLDDYVYITGMAYEFEVISVSAKGCKLEQDCEYRHTKFRCEDVDIVDIVCPGLQDDSTCKLRSPLPQGQPPPPTPLQTSLCISVVYVPDGNYAWLCDDSEDGVVVPEAQGEATCRRINARQEDLRWWTDYYRYRTPEPIEALFSSAYGQQKTVQLDVPSGEEPFTVVTWWWLVPVFWLLSVALTVSVLKLFVQMKKYPTPVIAHDERGLTRLLGRQIEKRKEWEQVPQKGFLRVGEDEYMVCVVLHDDVREKALVRNDGSRVSAISHVPLTLEPECRCPQRDAGTDLR